MPVLPIRCVLLAAPFLLLAGTASAAGLPEPAASYTAMQTIAVDGQEMTARIFHDRGKERREMSIQGADSVMILNPQQGTGYILQPQLNMAMEVPLGGTEAGPDPVLLGELDAVVDGQDPVAGLETTRYRVSGVKDGKGFAGLVWSTEDGIYAKVEGKLTDGVESADMRLILDDVNRGPQEPSLFQLPPNVRVMDMAPLSGRTPEALRPDR